MLTAYQRASHSFRQPIPHIARLAQANGLAEIATLHALVFQVAPQVRN